MKNKRGLKLTFIALTCFLAYNSRMIHCQHELSTLVCFDGSEWKDCRLVSSSSCREPSAFVRLQGKHQLYKNVRPKLFSRFRKKRSLLERPCRPFFFLAGMLVEATDLPCAFRFYQQKNPISLITDDVVFYFQSRVWMSKFIMSAVRKDLGKEMRREMNLMGLFISLLRHLTCFCFLSYGSFWRGCGSGKDKQSGWLISAAVLLPSHSMLPLFLGHLPLLVLLFFASVFSLRGPRRKKTVANGEAFMCYEWGRWAKVELVEGCAHCTREAMDRDVKTEHYMPLWMRLGQTGGLKGNT